MERGVHDASSQQSKFPNHTNLRCIRLMGLWCLCRLGVVPEWAGHIASSHIAVKEMVPIVIAAAVWGPQWRGKTVRAQCDNAAVVTIINHGSSRDQDIMHLMRCLAFIAAKFEFHIWAQHIKGVDNTLADVLSRNNLHLFTSLHSQASQLPATIPAALLDLLIVSRPNWTSQHWTELWSTIFRMD